MTARRSSGRCRKAASTRARIRCRRRAASSTRRPACARVTLLAEAPGWINYDLPRDLVGIGLKGKYRGQTQKWFAFRFDGDDSEIQHQSAARRPCRRVRPMGVEADGRIAGADRAVQAQGLRAGGRGLPPSGLTAMSRAQTVRLACSWRRGTACCCSCCCRFERGRCVFGIAAFLILGGIGERYFRRHATPRNPRRSRGAQGCA